MNVIYRTWINLNHLKSDNTKQYTAGKCQNVPDGDSGSNLHEDDLVHETCDKELP